MAQLDAGRLVEQRHRQMQRAVEAGRAHHDAVRLGFRGVDELLQRLVGLLVVDHDDHRVGDEARDRDEIGAGEFRRAAEQLVDLGKARDRRDVGEQRVAVGLGIRGELRADRAGRAGLGLDHHRLLDHRLEHGGERARHHIGGAAGRERIDEGDRARRVILRERRRGDSGSGGGEEAASVHPFLPVLLFWRTMRLRGPQRINGDAFHRRKGPALVAGQRAPA